MKNKSISELLNGYPVFGCMYPTNSIIKFKMSTDPEYWFTNNKRFKTHESFNGFAPEIKLKQTTMEKVSVSKKLMKTIVSNLKNIMSSSSECDELARKIEAELPELFKPKFKIGEWYKCDGGLYFFRIYKIEANRFHYDNDENDEKRFFRLPSHFYDHSIPATPQEIENHLIKLAKKKGFKAGVTISKDGINSRFDFTFRPINRSFAYSSRADILDSGWGHVYQAGKWATTVEGKPSDTIKKNEAILRTDPKIKTFSILENEQGVEIHYWDKPTSAASLIWNAAKSDRKAEVSKAFRELQNRVDDLLNNI